MHKRLAHMNHHPKVAPKERRSYRGIDHNELDGPWPLLALRLGTCTLPITVTIQVPRRLQINLDNQELNHSAQKGIPSARICINRKTFEMICVARVHADDASG